MSPPTLYKATHQAAGVRDLRRSHPGKDAARPAHPPRGRLALPRPCQPRVPDAAKRQGLRHHPGCHLEGQRLPHRRPRQRPHRPLQQLRGPRPQRPRPGSYAWPDLRRSVEAGYAAGATPGQAHAAVQHQHGAGPARPPSRRTIQRWHAQRRWVAQPP